MNVTLRPPMTRAQFLQWAGHENGRFEFDGVRPVPMTGGSRGHGSIVGGLAYALMKRLEGTSWSVIPDTGLATAGDAVRYPDIQVTGTASPGTDKLIPGTVVVFEVLSPSSARVDRVTKVREYAAVPTIRRYVMVEQDAPAVTVLWRPDAAAPWQLTAAGAGEVLELPELGITVPVDEIYAQVAFPADDAQD